MAYPYFNPYQQMSLPSYQPNIQGQQMQNSSLIHVMSEEQARSYPVPLGQSMMFINDNQPYCYTKTAGMSQLEPPVFKIFEVKEVGQTQSQPAQEESQPAPQVDMSEYMTKAEFESYKAIIDDMQKIVKELNGNE